ncbi:DNA polymerase III subunit alpha [Candidatus Vidania fulgoroideorum]
MINLKNYSEYSTNFGYMKIKEIYSNNNVYKNIVCVTDYSNISSLPELVSINKKYIISCELLIIDYLFKIKGNITFIVKNKKGYKNLIKLINISSNNKKKTGKKFLRFKNIKEFNKGLYMYSGGKYSFNKGIFYKSIKDMKLLFLFLKKKGINLFVEIQKYSKESSKEINKLLKFSKQIKAKVIATHPSLFNLKSDYKFCKAKFCINKKRNFFKKIKYIKKNQYFINENNFIKKFSCYSFVFKNIKKITKNCNFKFKKILQFPKISENDPSFILKKKIFSSSRIYLLNNPKYIKRIIKEISIINKLKFSTLFLIVYDLIKWTRKKNILSGPGRGSGASSLVSYILKITDVDPIKNKLIFERFLNKNQRLMPDFDLDFNHYKRSKVIKYIKKKYGKDNVYNIVTFGRFSLKNSLRDVGRILGFRYSQINKITNSIDYRNNSNNVFNIDKKLFEISKNLSGRIRNKGIHPGGIVIINNIKIPFYSIKNNKICQFDKSKSEIIGLIKLDILGLKTLTLLSNIKKITNFKYGFSEIKYNDYKVFKFLTYFNTGIFQLESFGMKRILYKIKPNSFNQLISIISLNRPGPIDFFDEFYKNKKNEIFYSITKKTNGIFIFQEQITMLINKCFKYNINESEILRRKIKENNNKIFEILKKKVRKKFKVKINYIFYILKKFSGYAFNKAHAVSYAKLTYYSSFLKRKFFIKYIICFLNIYFDNKEKLRKIQNECFKKKISFLYPDINLSSLFFKEENKDIRFGFIGIKNLGKEAANYIIKVRSKKNFSSFYNFFYRVDRNIINKRKIESLIKSGCFKENKIEITLFLKNTKYHKSNLGQLTIFDKNINLDLKKKIFSYKSEFKCIGTFIKNPLIKLKKKIYSLINKRNESFNYFYFGIVTKIIIKKNTKLLYVEDEFFNIRIINYNIKNLSLLDIIIIFYINYKKYKVINLNEQNNNKNK